MPRPNLHEIQNEVDRRSRESIRIYRPYGDQIQVHTSEAKELVVRGGKRSGKTVSVSQEIGSRITGIPILDSDGNPIPPRWPVPAPDYPRTYWFIGYDLNHIGQTIHRIMFQQGMGGQFRCIKDETTGLWRAWNRADPSDVKRIKESRLTEPTIPPRMIIEDSWQWEDKRGNHFKSVMLTNGARIFAFPSTGIHPKMGDSVSGIWIDEDIAYPEHLKEWQDRLTDENGWFIWSVWPHMKNPALLGLIERAELATLQEKPKIQSVQLIMSQNPYIPQEGKEAALERMGSEEEIARRDRGDVNMDSYSMYSFDAKIHCIKRKAEIAAFEPERSHVYELIRRIYERRGNVPSDWTRYLVIDPSHTRTGVQSWCVPPQILDDIFVGNLMLCEWELVCKRMTAEDIAKSIANSAGTNQYEAFIIDNRAGRQTHAGRDSNTRTFFSMAFREAGLASRLTNADFIPGCDVPPTRYRAVRNLMEVVPGVGVPSLMLIDERCPQTKKEFTKYLKKRISTGTDSDSVMDEPANPRLYDLMACTEYAAAHLERLFIQGSAYVEPTVYKGKGSYAYRKAMSMKKGAESDDGVVMLGVG